MLVDERQALHDLFEISLYIFFRKLRRPDFNHIVQVFVQEVENQMQFIVYAENLSELNHVVLGKFPQTFDFSEAHGFVP